MCKTKLLIADNHAARSTRGSLLPTLPAAFRFSVLCVPTRQTAFASLHQPLCLSSHHHHHPPSRSNSAPSLLHPRAMSLLLITLLSSLMLRDAAAWGANVKYAVNCPDRCSAERCGATQRCARTVLDDCGCCQVCAAGRGEHCYRTVSGMHGVKCGPGLFCEFYKDEDDYGDEYGICKDCLYGTYGMECRKTCNCKGGICDRETGACLNLKFFAKIADQLKTEPQEGGEMGSGEVSAAQDTDPHTDRPTGPRRLNPR